MLMVIFGAGASYDSAASLPAPQGPPEANRDYPDRPPLASELFHPQRNFALIARNYPALLEIVDRLRNLEDDSVETRLQSLQDERSTWPRRYQQLMSVRFYLSDVLSNCVAEWQNRASLATNYGHLIDDIGNWNARQGESENICLVTFNYDVLLESALGSAGCKFQTKVIEDYVKSESIFKVFKLHGSVNWKQVAERYTAPPRAVSREQIIENAATLESAMTNDFLIEQSATNYQGRWLVPAIAIPVQDKTGRFACPRDHLAHLESLIPHVTQLLVIGWRGKEGHFTSMLRRNLKRIKAMMIVDANRAAAEVVAKDLVGELGSVFEGMNVRVGERGFSHFIRSKESKEFFFSEIRRGSE
jgi:hypothetical protein